MLCETSEKISARKIGASHLLVGYMWKILLAYFSEITKTNKQASQWMIIIYAELLINDGL